MFGKNRPHQIWDKTVSGVKQEWSLAPLNEQKHIVEKIEELLSSVNQIESSIGQVMRHVGVAEKVLAKVSTGKLS